MVTGVVDTGLELSYLLAVLAARGPATLEVAAMIDKPARRIVPLTLDSVGMEVADGYGVGYGRGFAGRYRNLPGLWPGRGGGAGSRARPAICSMCTDPARPPSRR